MRTIGPRSWASSCLSTTANSITTIRGLSCPTSKGVLAPAFVGVLAEWVNNGRTPPDYVACPNLCQGTIGVGSRTVDYHGRRAVHHCYMLRACGHLWPSLPNRTIGRGSCAPPWCNNRMDVMVRGRRTSDCTTQKRGPWRWDCTIAMENVGRVWGPWRGECSITLRVDFFRDQEKSPRQERKSQGSDDVAKILSNPFWIRKWWRCFLMIVHLVWAHWLTWGCDYWLLTVAD